MVSFKEIYQFSRFQRGSNIFQGRGGGGGGRSRPFASWVILHAFLLSTDFFFSKNSFRNTISVSNRLDPDQVLHFVGSDLGPNCLQKLSAEDTSRYKMKRLIPLFHTGPESHKLTNIWIRA